MKLSELEYLLDLITEDEMKQFNNEFITLKKVQEFKGNPRLLKRTKMFWYQINEKTDLWFQFEIAPFIDRFQIYFEVNAFYNNGWSGGYDELFLAHRYHLIEPFLPFFEEKKRLVKDTLEKDPGLRLLLVTGADTKIDIFNSVVWKYQGLKEFYHDIEYEKKIEKIKKSLIKDGSIKE
jgi:hypothetical protein